MCVAHKLNHFLDFFYRTDRQKSGFLYIYNIIKASFPDFFSFLKVAWFYSILFCLSLCKSGFPQLLVDEERRPFYSISILPRSTVQ